MTNDETPRRPGDVPVPAPWASATPPPAQPARTEPLAPAAEDDPWLDVTPAPRTPPAPRPGGPRRLVAGAALVAAGAVLGAVIVGAVNRDADAVAVQQQAGAATAGQGQVGGVPGGLPGGGPGQGGRGGLGQGGPGRGGEERVTGTLTAVGGSSVTVRTSAGTASYQLLPQTQVVRGGTLVSAADLQVGDQVLAHVFPSASGDGVLERLIVTGAGTAGTDGTS